MEISGSLSDTARVLAGGWTRNGNGQPQESAGGEGFVRHIQGPVGPNAPESQPQEQAQGQAQEQTDGGEGFVKHIQGPAGPDAPESRPQEEAQAQEQAQAQVQQAQAQVQEQTQEQAESETTVIRRGARESARRQWRTRISHAYSRNYFLKILAQRRTAFFRYV